MHPASSVSGVCAILLNLPDVTHPYLHIGKITLGTFGLFMWLAFVTAYLVVERDFDRRELKADANTLIALAALFGLIGAKLWNSLESPHELFLQPVGVLFNRTGFAWYGGFIGGIVVILLLGKRWRVPLLCMLDACAPASALGYAVGRIGCLISGDGDYGLPTNLPWAMTFVNGIDPTSVPSHPTPIYEFLVCSAIGWFLWRRFGKHLPDGEVLAEFLVLMGMERFLVEFIRRNPRIFLNTFSNAQMASLLTLMVGAALWFWLRARGHESARPASVRM